MIEVSFRWEADPALPLIPLRYRFVTFLFLFVVLEKEKVKI